MLIRALIFIIGLLITALGVTQIFFTSMWMRYLPSLVSVPMIRNWGIAALVAGALLLIGAIANLVRLRWFVLFLGALTLAGGILMVVRPGLSHHFIEQFLLDRSPSVQRTILRGSGVLRVVIGIALMYAAAALPPRRNGGRIWS
ncbi:MAG: hypothetical protein ABFD54_17995 [Armatimonadota bacterium]|nr:hypothetical protein [bacterium]